MGVESSGLNYKANGKIRLGVRYVRETGQEGRLTGNQDYTTESWQGQERLQGLASVDVAEET